MLNILDLAYGHNHNASRALGHKLVAFPLPDGDLGSTSTTNQEAES